MIPEEARWSNDLATGTAAPIWWRRFRDAFASDGATRSELSASRADREIADECVVGLARSMRDHCTVAVGPASRMVAALNVIASQREARVHE